MESFQVESVYENLLTAEEYANLPLETNGADENVLTKKCSESPSSRTENMQPVDNGAENLQVDNGSESLPPQAREYSTFPQSYGVPAFHFSQEYQSIDYPFYTAPNCYQSWGYPPSYAPDQPCPPQYAPEQLHHYPVDNNELIQKCSESLRSESLQPDNGYELLQLQNGLESLPQGRDYGAFIQSYGVHSFQFGQEYQSVEHPFYTAPNYYQPWGYPLPYAPEQPYHHYSYPYNSPVLPTFSSGVTYFPTLPTCLSYETNESVPPNESNVAKTNAETSEKVELKPKAIDTQLDAISQKIQVSTSSLANDEKIRFRNRDYYGLPVRVNVSKTENSNQTLMYNLTTKQSKSTSKPRGGGGKRIATRNPLSTKITVKNLKKLLEMQDKILPPLKNNNFAGCSSKEAVGSATSEGGHHNSHINEQTRPTTNFNGILSTNGCSNASVEYPLMRYKSPLDVKLVDLIVDKKRVQHLRNRSYVFDSLQIGSFVVQSTPQNISRNKLRFYFSQKQMVYDFEYSYHVDDVSVSVLLLVMVYIPLDSIVSASFRSREVEFILNQAPRIVSGFDRKKVPALLKMQNFGKKTIDVTRGALNSVLVHKVTLPRAQGELIEKHFLQYNPALPISRV